MSTRAVDRRVQLRSTVSRRLREPETMELLAAAIARVATVAMYPSTRAVEPAERLLEGPAATVAGMAVEALVDELQDLVAALPEAEVVGLLTQQHVADLGIE